jgi:excinuclease ABC subunit A
MHFLANAYVNCDSCLGKRYNHSILNIKFKEKSIADVLSLSIEEACDFFSAQPLLYQKLRVLKDVGLGYISLGQSSTSLSGGEAQRIKLAKELSKKSTGRTLFILDEPTTGLHYADIEKLLNVLHHIVDEGNTVLVIEHNIDFIKNFDYLYDLGPEGGADGGEIIDQGTPEQIANNCKGATGEWLKKALKM